MPSFELEQNHNGPVVGIDEVGCGPWAGPVVAASFIFHQYDVFKDLLLQINDSKKVPLKKRQTLLKFLSHGQGKQWSYAVGIATVDEIDTLNIRQAALLAMERSFNVLNLTGVTFALVDGICAPNLPIPVKTIKKGDSFSYSIAAASIVAKVYRDDLMVALAQNYPGYGWEKNVGYGTKAHQQGLTALGVTPYHRKSFAPIVNLLSQTE